MGHQKVIYIIGVYLLILGILFDEGTTIIAYLSGLGIMETNPIATRYGLPAFFFVGLCFYMALIWTWGYVIKLYRRFYEQRATGYKLYDIFLFFFCILIVFTTAQKIEVGYDNIQLISRSYNKDTGPIIKEHIAITEQIKADSPEIYQLVQDTSYKEATVSKLNYLQMFFYIIGSYLLFRIGYKVCPYEYG